MQPGTKLGPYEIKEPLGAGGMGEVYRARDTRLGREVAVKLVRRDRLGPSAVEELLREAQTAASLNHPHICTIHDVGEERSQPFIGMEYVEGETLTSIILAGGLPAETVIRIGTQIASALSHAHSKGVIHRDLKPANVSILPSGDAKVLDFGLARQLGDRELESFRSSLTTLVEMEEAAAGDQVGGPAGAGAGAGVGGGAGIAGTLPYMAPEVLRGEGADERSDLWALGVLLYEAATGQLPFEGKTGFELTSAILKDPCPALPDGVPPGLAAVIRKCLSKEPARRHRTAGEVQSVLEMLDPGVDSQEQVSRPRTAEGPASAPTEASPSRSPLRTRRLPLLGVAALLVLGAAAIVLDVGGVRSLLTGVESPDPGTGAAASIVGGSVPQIRSLAVLPLDNLSGDPDQDYFSAGMTEALTAELAQIGALKVISRTSAMQYEGTDKLMPEIADELGVDALVEGSVLQAEDRVRITLQLVHGPTDRHLWAHSYEREMRDILALQGEVARAIADEVQVALEPEEEARLAEARPVDPEAHRLSLKAFFHFTKLTEESIRRALGLYREATTIDPTYAPPYAGVAIAYSQLGSWVASEAPEDAIPKAKEAAERALALDPDLALAHLALAAIRLQFEWDWEGAERSFKRTIELNPSFSWPYSSYGFLLAILGRTEEAIELGRQAVEIDPLAPSHYFNLALSVDLLGRREEAMELYRQGFELAPEHFQGHMVIHGFHYARRGEFDKAISHVEQALAIQEPPDALGRAGYIYARAGRREKALGILARLMEQRESAYASPTSIAHVYLGLGQHDEALRWLETAYEERDVALVWLKEGWRFAPLRDDPRYQALLRRMNFPES